MVRVCLFVPRMLMYCSTVFAFNPFSIATLPPSPLVAVYSLMLFSAEFNFFQELRRRRRRPVRFGIESRPVTSLIS